MCGRIYVKDSPSTREIRRLLDLGGFNAPTLNNVCPTEQIPVIHHTESGYAVDMMRWWLHPFWSKEPPNQKYAMFNARIETVATTAAYREPLKQRRAIVPAAAFIEWKTEGKIKYPYYIEPIDGPLAIAAIWDCWQDTLLSCAVITQPANEAFMSIHTRMPLTLVGDQVKRWLDPGEDSKQLLKDFSGNSVQLSAREVERDINNGRNKVEVTFK